MYYAGLDVSLKETFISIVDSQGTIVKEGTIPSDSKSLSMYLKGTGLELMKVGVESGQLSISVCKG